MNSRREPTTVDFLREVEQEEVIVTKARPTMVLEYDLTYFGSSARLAQRTEPRKSRWRATTGRYSLRSRSLRGNVSFATT